MMIDTTEFYIFIPIWKTLPSWKITVRSTNFEKVCLSAFIFLEISQLIWMKFSMLPLPVDVHITLISNDQYSKEETLFRIFFYEAFL